MARLATILTIAGLMAGGATFHPLQAVELGIAASQTVPTFGEDHLPYHINYDDLTAVLQNVVLITGMSDRSRAPSVKGNIGTRFKTKRNVYTAYEGNRIWLEALEDERALEVLGMIRHGLETLPDNVPISQFSDAEQIAFWLNLHNVAFLEELVQHSQNGMKNLLYRGDDAMLDKKLVTVQGVPLSLNDIRFNIVGKRWGDSPLVIYGFFEGIIGGPNIRKEAFTGEKLHEQLSANAREFVNSNRGVYLKGGKTMHVSSFYERFESYFPNFQKDLRAHLLEYLVPGGIQAKVANSRRLDPDVDDWTVASVRGNTREYGGALQTNGAAMATAIVRGQGGEVASDSSLTVSGMADSVKNFSRFTLEQQTLLMRLNKQRMARTGNVRIEELQEIKDRVERTKKDETGEKE